MSLIRAKKAPWETNIMVDPKPLTEKGKKEKRKRKKEKKKNEKKNQQFC